MEKKKRGTQMNMTYEQFNEQMDVVGEAITTMLNDNADKVSRVSVAGALIEVLSDLIVYETPNGEAYDVPEEWVFDMLKEIIKHKRESRDSAQIN